MNNDKELAELMKRIDRLHQHTIYFEESNDISKPQYCIDALSELEEMYNILKSNKENGI